MFKPKTFKQAALKGLVTGVVSTALMGVALFISSQQSVEGVMVVPEQGQAQEQAVDRFAEVVEAKCHDFAEGTIPEHAVVRLPGQAVKYTTSQVAFDLWGPDAKPGTSDDRPGEATFCR